MQHITTPLSQTRNRTHTAATLFELIATLTVVGILAAAITVVATSTRDNIQGLASLTQMQAAYASGRTLTFDTGGFPADLDQQLNVENMTVIDAASPSTNATELSVATSADNRSAAYVVRNGEGCIGIYDNIATGTAWVEDTSAESCTAADLIDGAPSGVQSGPSDRQPFEFGTDTSS